MGRAEYKVVESVYFNQSHRMTRDRHGVYITFVQAGTIGKFNFQTALVSLVASLGLLGMSTFIVDSLMLYCCKKKKRYQEEKFQVTKDYAKDPKIFLSHRQKSHNDHETDIQPGASSHDG